MPINVNININIYNIFLNYNKVRLKSKPFIVMVPVIIFSVMYGMFMANCYKLYGLSMGMDDKSLTIIGSIGSAFNGCSRAFWAILMDKIGYKKTYFFLIILNLLTTSTIGYV
jgi:OFA family oxalate/formate antiporter-like MFS transporter